MGHTLVWVVDVELLQEEAVIEEAVGHLGQELQDDPSLRAQEHHRMIPIWTGRTVYSDPRQPIPVYRRTQRRLMRERERRGGEREERRREGEKNEHRSSGSHIMKSFAHSP